MSNGVKDEVSKNLLFYRKRNKMTQAELAEKIGVKNNTISQWESGTNAIDIEMLVYICDALSVDFNDMYGKYANVHNGYTPEARKVAALYDKATSEDKHVVHAVLDKYEQKKGTSDAKYDEKGIAG